MSKVISRDEEPSVMCVNKNGDLVDIEGKILFDTGNEGRTLITRKLAEKLELDIKACQFEERPVPGGNMATVTHDVDFPLFIRRHKIQDIRAQIGEPAGDHEVDLLIGMDVIEQLIARGYTIGN